MSKYHGHCNNLQNSLQRIYPIFPTLRVVKRGATYAIDHYGGVFKDGRGEPAIYASTYKAVYPLWVQSEPKVVDALWFLVRDIPEITALEVLDKYRFTTKWSSVKEAVVEIVSITTLLLREISIPQISHILVRKTLQIEDGISATLSYAEISRWNLAGGPQTKYDFTVSTLYPLLALLNTKKLMEAASGVAEYLWKEKARCDLRKDK